MYPVGALVPGGVSGGNCVAMFTLTQNKWKIDAVLGVWPLHGLGSAWGGIAAGVFGSTALSGLGGTSFLAQLLGTLRAVAWAELAGLVVCAALKAMMGLRLTHAEDFYGADRTIHRISATPERAANW